MPVPKFLLASASPRRRDLLRLLNISFQVTTTNVDESTIPGESAASLVVRLSRLKAQAAMSGYPDMTIIAADTDVELDGSILGKPRDGDDARAMLRALRGREHIVHGGLTILNLPSENDELAEARGIGRASTNGEVTLEVCTRVWMRNYYESEIEAYVDSGDPLDKAAGYAVQHLQFSPVDRVEGCFANVMGLPLCHLWNALAAHLPMPEPCLGCHLHAGGDCTVPRLVEQGIIAGN